MLSWVHLGIFQPLSIVRLSEPFNPISDALRPVALHQGTLLHLPFNAEHEYNISGIIQSEDNSSNVIRVNLLTSTRCDSLLHYAIPTDR